MKITAYILFLLGFLGLVDLMTTSMGHQAMLEYYNLDVENFGYISAILFELGNSVGIPHITSTFGAILHNAWFFLFLGGWYLLKQSKQIKHAE